MNRLERVFFRLIVAISLFFGIASLYAQQTIITLPSADQTPKGTWFFCMSLNVAPHSRHFYYYTFSDIGAF